MNGSASSTVDSTANSAVPSINSRLPFAAPTARPTEALVMQPASRAVAPAWPDPARPVVVGASGGVGTSAVAAMVCGVDAGVWRTDVLGPLPRPDLVVAGVSVEAMTRAQRLIGQYLVRLEVRPLLVIVSDGRGRPPADSRAVLTLLRPLVRDVVQLPYVPAWRARTSPGGLSAPTGAALSAVNRLRVAVGLTPLLDKRGNRS